MSIILPAERHFAVRKRNQSVIGYSDTMRVACQVLKNVFRSAEWWFDVDHPIMPAQLAKKAAEESGFGKMLEIAMKLKLSVAEEALEAVHEFAAKHAAEHLLRKQEVVLGMNPARVIR